MFVVRPLFFNHPVQRGEKLSKAISGTISKIRKGLNQCAQESRQEELAKWAYCPVLKSRQLKLTLSLRRRMAQCRFLFVSFAGLDRTLAFTPSVPELWFEINRGQTLRKQAVEVLQHHFRKLEKEAGDEHAKPERFSLTGKAWVDYVELNIEPGRARTRILLPASQQALAQIFSEKTASGAEELDRCARCINELFPDDLKRAHLREQEVEELETLLAASDKRPVLLLGPAQVGKTTIIHEFVFRTVKRRRQAFAANNNVWLLSPQRLISGMSCVGQWENRLLAIIKEVKQRKHILYFDDLPGLIHAGVSRESSLSVAQVLRPHVERREFRMLAEITPPCLRLLREQDRAFADQFHVLPIAEPSAQQNLSILIHALRYLEGQRSCRFQVDALPTVLDLQRRYARHLAFPGKAAGFLEQLSVKNRETEISRETVIREFQLKSGLSMSFVDDGVKLARQDIIAALHEDVIGQEDAVNAMADAVCIAKARLNDPDRPLGTFLFLGPTGVGKTQCAKSLAEYLFGSTDRLLRFDMNEYVSAASVQRLTGTLGDPQGLITSSVIQEPFCVVLLDEIEKAHPDVFDLLLQLLGEGRLTNALGQTADFTNTVVIMTSNLGTREASARLGFTTGDIPRDDSFVQAARDYFRPEFFNRIDRIIPFRQLSRDDIWQIAQGLIRDVLEREGLQRRKCMLKVELEAMDVIVDAGYHPHLGARALKRAIERRLTQPVATRLAVMQAQAPVLIRVYAQGDQVASDIQELANAEVKPLAEECVDLSSPTCLLDRAKSLLTCIGEDLPDLGFEAGVATAELSADHYRYLFLRHLLDRLGRKCRNLLQGLEKNKPPLMRPNALPSARRRGHRLRNYWHRNPYYWGAIWAAADIHEYLNDLTGESEPYGTGMQGRLADLIRGLCWIDTAARTSGQAHANRCLISITSILGQFTHEQDYLSQVYQSYFGHTGKEAVHDLTGKLQHLEIIGENSDVLLVERTAAWAEARIEEGTHLFLAAHGSLIPVAVRVIGLDHGRDPGEALVNMNATSDASDPGDPIDIRQEQGAQRLGPVIRVYDRVHGKDCIIMDCRSGLMVKDKEELASHLSVFMHSQLPVPQTLLE